jgi:hypothetical protein
MFTNLYALVRDREWPRGPGGRAQRNEADAVVVAEAVLQFGFPDAGWLAGFDPGPLQPVVILVHKELLPLLLSILTSSM